MGGNSLNSPDDYKGKPSSIVWKNLIAVRRTARVLNLGRNKDATIGRIKTYYIWEGLADA